MAWSTRYGILLGIIGLLAACGSSDEASGGNTGGSSQGSAGSAGNENGGVTNAGGANGNRGGTLASVGGGTSTGKNCSPTNVTCKIAVPACEAMQVPELTASGTCYTGNCIPIGDCSCNASTDCPDNNQYVCRNDIKRCSPFL